MKNYFLIPALLIAFKLFSVDSNFDFAIAHDVQSDSGDSYQYSIFIKNIGNQTVKSWNLQFDLNDADQNQKIVDLQGGDIISDKGRIIINQPKLENGGIISPEQTVEISFKILTTPKAMRGIKNILIEPVYKQSPCPVCPPCTKTPIAKQTEMKIQPKKEEVKKQESEVKKETREIKTETAPVTGVKVNEEIARISV